ncbi:probable apyrase 7 [Vigna umbellata]|uniref:probable apyrase 7 n=1 Tax=Vigna umbellata TaxID=87088 RepID=UPI001F5E4D0D|nr:probable apyrase 7 [Vigna umbellata]
MEHRIMAYSFPAFGLNEAFDRTVLMLRNNQGEERTASIADLKHPCLLSTYVQNYTCHSCSALASIYEKNHSQDQESELYSLRLTGEPNWEQCKELAIGAAMNPSSKVSHLTVSRNCQASLVSGTGTDILNLTAVAQPAKFHALSGFFFVYNKLNLSPRTNLTMVAYMASLIDYGLCLGDVEVVFGPGDISWTLGAALIEGKFLWLNSTSYETHAIISTLKNVKVTSSPTVLFAVLVLLSLIVYCSQIKLPMPSRRDSASGSSLPSYTPVRRRSN